MLKAIDDGAESDRGGVPAGVSRSPIEEIVRDGARQMLEAALQAEVAAWVERFTDQLDENGRKLVACNGYRNERQVLTAIGSVTVTAHRDNDETVDPESGERHWLSPANLPARVWKTTRHRGVAAAVSARAVHRGLRSRAGAVVWLGSRTVASIDHPVDRPLSLPRCGSQARLGALAAVKNIYNAEAIDKRSWRWKRSTSTTAGNARKRSRKITATSSPNHQPAGRNPHNGGCLKLVDPQILTISPYTIGSVPRSPAVVSMNQLLASTHGLLRDKSHSRYERRM